jgi:hypothetical protein
MAERIVVTFRGILDGSERAASEYLARALATTQRAEAHGATLCAWSAHTFSFEFAVDELEEALALASIALPKSGAEPTESERYAAARFMVGVAEGALDRVGEEGPFAALSWGAALVIAVSLSRDAMAGEVLLDGAFAAARKADLEALGWTSERELMRGAHLLKPFTPPPPDAEVHAPPPRAAVSSASHSTPPRPPAAPSHAGASTPPRAPPPSPSHAGASTPPRAPPPLPPIGARQSMPSRQPLPPPRHAPPPAAPPAPAPPTPSVVPAPRPSEAAPRSEAALRALAEGDGPAIDRIVSELRAEDDGAADLLSGVAALRRGATGDALRLLRIAATAEAPPAKQARARLGYAVALAAAGRAELALLEALEALARARQARDAGGEIACARFLSELSAVQGSEAARTVWEQVGN